MPMKIIRDPIHGFIEYNELEEKIINTRVFQRLRNIKQLAFAHYVYPGALHTRFDHSLGVMHLANKMAKRLFTGEGYRERIETIRLAGLLHDIGHGPFSHVSEQLLEENTSNLDDLKKEYKAANAHELMSILIIQYHDEIDDILNDKSIKEGVIQLIKESENSEGFLEKDIVSGPLDADKLDYILRDSYFAGVKYGVFDIEKLIESMVPIPISSTEKRVGIREEGVFALEQFLLANYHMKMQVYYHSIRRIADAMLIRGINLAIEDGAEEIRELFSIKDNRKYIQNYIQYNDYSLIDKALQADTKSSDYFERLKRRALFKEICFLELSKNELGVDAVTYNRIMKMSNSDTHEISESISEFLNANYGLTKSIEPRTIIIDKQSFTNPTFKTPGITIDAKTIYVLCEKNEDFKNEDFHEISGIFSNPSIEREKIMLYVYAPIDNVDENERKSMSKDLRSHVKEFLKGL